MSPDGRCVFVKSDSARCAVRWGLLDDGYCWHHSPTVEKERRAAKRKGGVVTGEKRRKARTKTLDRDNAPSVPETAAEAARWAALSIYGAGVGDLDPTTATCIQSGVRAFLAALKQSDYEARLEALEKRADEAERKAPQ